MKIGEIIEVDCGLIRPMPDQPRKRFDRVELDRLALSIKRIGQRRPITVRELSKDKYELVDGERRWRACKKLAIPVKAWVKDIADVKDQFLESVVSNFHTAPHDELETYEAIIRIRDDNEYTAQQIADVFGKSVTWVSFYISLSKLDPDVRQLLSRELPENERLPFTHAVEVARLPKAEDQRELATQVTTERLSLQQVKHRVNAKLAGALPAPRRPKRERDKFDNFLRRFRQDLEVLLLQKPQYFRDVFGSADTFRRDEMMQELTGLIDDAQALYAMLKKHVWKQADAPRAATAS